MNKNITWTELWHGQIIKLLSFWNIGRSGQRSGSRLATTFVASINYFFSLVFSSIVYFSHRRSAHWAKNKGQKDINRKNCQFLSWKNIFIFNRSEFLKKEIGSFISDLLATQCDIWRHFWWTIFFDLCPHANPLWSARINKNYLAKVDNSAWKHIGKHLSRPRWPFWGSLAAILDFVGGAGIFFGNCGCVWWKWCWLNDL